MARRILTKVHNAAADAI